MTLFLMALSFIIGILCCMPRRFKDAAVIFEQMLKLSNLHTAYEDEWAKRIDTEVLLTTCEETLARCMRGEQL